LEESSKHSQEQRTDKTEISLLIHHILNNQSVIFLKVVDLHLK
jgi:hypothetical protein